MLKSRYRSSRFAAMLADSVSSSVGQNRFDGVLRNPKLLRDFGEALAVVEVVYDRTDRQGCAA